MSLDFNHVCPFCAHHVGFRIIADNRHKDEHQHADTMAVCQSCGWASIARFYLVGGAVPPAQRGILDPKVHKFIFLLPKPPAPPEPKHVPQRIVQLLQQAHDNLTRKHWDAAGGMARKVVDVATKQLLPDSGNQTLHARITKLGEAGRLTKDLADWAQAIRTLGNDAAHDEDPFTQFEAETIYSFTELFLQYVYTLPGALQERRAGNKPAT